MEQWKSIIGYGDMYFISNFGNIKSFYKNTEKFLKPKKDKYLRVTLYFNGIYSTISIHRLVAIYFVPNPLNLPQVNHLNGDKLNNNDWNLAWCTKSENEKHAYKLNLKKRRYGNKARNKSNLSEEQALQIINYKKEGFSPKQISDILPIKLTTISGIYHGRRWAYLQKFI